MNQQDSVLLEPNASYKTQKVKIFYPTGSTPTLYAKSCSILF